MFIMIDPEYINPVVVVTDAYAKGVIADAIKVHVEPNGVKQLLMPELEVVLLHPMGTAPIDELIARTTAVLFNQDDLDTE